MKQAVLLAGGEGKRLRPYTLNVPKPMLPIVHMPLLEYSIRHLKKYGIEEIYMTTCYLGEKIKDYFQDGSSLGVTITYLEEASPLGTAGGIFTARNNFLEPFLVMSGDAFTNINIHKVYEFHQRHQSKMTIISKKVKDPSAFGVCFTNEDGKLERFIEKPTDYVGNQVNTGIYILNPEILFTYFFGKTLDFSKDLIPALLNDNESVYVYNTNEYWRDIGNIAAYNQAREDALTNHYSNKKKLDHVRTEEKVYVTRLEVECPVDYKSIVLERLHHDGDFILESDSNLIISHYNGGWTRIINQESSGFLIYSQAEGKNLSKEFARYYQIKIKQWQKV